jgi:hypothetical protein
MKKKNLYLFVNFMAKGGGKALIISMLIICSSQLSAQVTPNVVPDSGNVGIGTNMPLEKFEVVGKAKVHGKFQVTDTVQFEKSMTIDGNVEINSELTVRDTMRAQEPVIVTSNVYIKDTLKVEGVIDAKEIKTLLLSTEALLVNDISSINPEVVIGYFDFGWNQSPCDDKLIINYCNRRIYGRNEIAGQIYYPGICIGKNSMAVGMHSFAVGDHARASADNSIIIGSGASGLWFSNTKENSIWLGMNASAPSISVIAADDTWQKAGNVGINTASPVSEFQINESFNSINFGNAFNQDADWMSGYIAFNAQRERKQHWHTSTWYFTSDGQNAGASVISLNGTGAVYIIPIDGAGQTSDFQLTDLELKNRTVVKVHPRKQVQGNLTGGLLEVNGNIKAHEVEVLLTGWWDCVFQPDYELMSLDELRNFISQNGHLPDVPSEEYVLNNPVALGEMNALLLKKIEELTLYIFQLQDEIEQLKNGGE